MTPAAPASPPRSPPRSPFTRQRPVLIVFTTAMAAVHLTVWWGLFRGVPGGPAVGAGMAALFAALMATFTARVYQRPAPRLLASVAYLWLGVVFVAFVATLVTSPLRLATWLGGWPEATLALSVGTSGAVAGLTGFGWLAARRVGIARVEVPIDGLDPRLAGLTIAQISDVHVGHTTRAFLDDVVDRVNRLDPDLVAITGDLVEGTVEEVGADLVALTRLRARHGVYFVTGNHEYYGDGPKWAAFLPTLGLRVLRNERVQIVHDGAPLDVVGVDDPFGTMAPGHGTDLPRAVDGRDPSVAAVLLAHQPVTVDEAADHGIALQLSGHTHGGQIWPFHWLVRLVQPYLAGLVRHRGTWLYVHRGTGHWGPPLRIGAPPEIAVVTLAAGRSAP